MNLKSFYAPQTLKSLAAFLLFFQLFSEVSKAQMRQVYLDPDPDNHLQKISFYSSSQGYAAFTKWIGFTSDSGRTFTKKYITLNNVDFGNYTVNITFGFGIAGVKAFNQNTIIVYGDYGLVPAILYSNNGGNSFTLIYHSQYDPNLLRGGITDMIFPQNSNTGYAVDADRVLKTTNGGLNWSVIRTDPASYFTNLEAPDDNTVFAFSLYTYKLLKTLNAGSSFQVITLPAIPQGILNYAYFTTANNGWVAMHDDQQGGYIYKTTNGGGAWTLQNNAQVTSFSTIKMKFVDDNTGYGVGEAFSIYKTEDGGKIWEPLPRDNNFTYFNYFHNDLNFLNASQFWAGGGHGFLEITTNGGGVPLPRAFFRIDTTGFYLTGVVNLFNYSKATYQYKWYVNNVLISTNYNASYTHGTSSGLDSIKLVVSNGALSDSLVRYQYFPGQVYPSLSSFTPATGSTGTFITIAGNNFTGINGVFFGGVAASSFTVVSPTMITAIVGNGATGNVSVSNSQGTFSMPGFQYFAPPSSAPPAITSFSPAFGPPGTTVTLTGNNFNPGSNTVYFGATRAFVTAATSNEITCVVPFGASYQPISVLNTATNLTGYSFKPFSVTFADSAINFTRNSFARILTISYNNQVTGPKRVAGADLDNDGRPDLICSINYSYNSYDSMHVYRNTGIGGNFSFAARQNIGPLTQYGSGKFAVHDIDGDGKADIIGTTNSTYIPVFRNTSIVGNISFTAPFNIPTTSGGIQDITADDLDNDGRADIIAAGSSSNSAIIIVRNTSSPGNLSFAPGINYSLGSGGHGTSVATGDIDGDGKKDIVVFSLGLSGSNNVVWFRNTGTTGSISFTSGTNITTSENGLTGDIFLFDFDGDNKLDIVLLAGSKYKLFRNLSTPGNISFDAAITYTAGGGAAAVGNLSGGNRPDVVLANDGTSFTLYKNLSTPNTIINDNGVSISSDVFSFGTGVADFNGDGQPDIALASWNNDQLCIFKNVMGAVISLAICEFHSIGTTADVSGTAYQWQQDSGSGFVNISDNSIISGTQTSEIYFSNTPHSMDGYKYRCTVDGTHYSSTYLLQVTPFPVPDVSISTPLTTICAGTSVTFTATPVNAGTNPSYQWQVNGINRGSDLPSFSTFTFSNLANNDQVRVIITSTATCSGSARDTSNVITMTVNGVLPSVSISASATTICTGSPATFTATPVNGGTNPSYQWQVNGVNAGTNSNTFTTSSLVNGDVVKVAMTSNINTCSSPPVNSNSITMTVSPLTTPSVTIIGPSTLCQGTPTSFTALAVNGGSAPAYQWKKNGVNVGTNNNIYNTNSLVNGDVISVVLTSNAPCTSPASATSNSITMTINPALTPSITISGTTTVSQGQSASIQSSISNGGSDPVYQWQDSSTIIGWLNIGGATLPTINYTPAAGGVKLRCRLTSNVLCATIATVTSNTLIFTVTTVTAINPIPASAYGIRLYPNPAHATFIIDTLKISDRWQTLDITSMDGRYHLLTKTISGQSSINMNVNSLPAGLYLVILRRKTGAPAYLKLEKQ